MFNFDRRNFLYIIIGLIVVRTLIDYATHPASLFALLLGIPGVLIAITFHEFAHAFAADKLGDDTARREGRLSLNPKDHLDPVGTIMLLFAGFGWGKPVHVNPVNYTRKMSMEKGEAIVSIAGPVMNFILAFVFTLIYFAIYKFVGTNFILTNTGYVVMLIIQSIISVNIGLGVFNLIPLPPLDGSKVIMPFLPYNAKNWFARYEQVFYFIFVAIWITGIAGYIITPAISLISSGFLNLGSAIFGI